MTEAKAKRPAINWMDVLWLVLLAALALFPASQARARLLSPAENWSGHAVDSPYRRSSHQQLLLSDLLPAGSYGGGVFRPLGHAVLDVSGVGRLLLLSLSRIAGVRNYRGRLRTACHPHSLFLSRGDGGQPFRH